jgi:serine/threonine-protein kinase RsbW
VTGANPTWLPNGRRDRVATIWLTGIDLSASAMLPILVPRADSNGWMPPKPQRIEVVLETRIESIALAEEVGLRIAAAAGFNEDDQYKIGLAVHECVMNAFQYGNEQRREKKIYVLFELLHEKLVIHVTDQGTGFRLEDVPDPREDENVLGESGRGVLLMKAFMDEFDVLVSASGSAEVVMAKRHRAPGSQAN